ncbi:hypothetical protein ACFZ8E_25110 [Methylobacterium sp. HMF5984]|uniref:phage head spike fiber domain-containing protein n=1 Tax=Methylobacterium sp. HMF5984 TaxID=3367370 RepID=UPI0038543A5E
MAIRPTNIFGGGSGPSGAARTNAGLTYTATGLKVGSTAILYGNGTQLSSVTVDGTGKATWTLGTAPVAGTNITYDGVVVGSGGTIPAGQFVATSLGVYLDNARGSGQLFQDFIGTPVAYGDQHIGRASLSDMTGSFPFGAGLIQWVGPQYVAVPLVPTGGTLAAAANGDYNATFTAIAQGIIANRPGLTALTARIGWEFNNNFQPWGTQPGGVVGTAYTVDQLNAFYATAFQKAATALRAVFAAAGITFRAAWVQNLGEFDAAPAYPGDAYVDVIGCDAYQTQYLKLQSTDPNNALSVWNDMLNRPFGLQVSRDFARAHGKPFYIPEFGVQRDDFAPIVRAAYDWCTAQQVESIGWWDSNSDYPSKVSDGSLPNIGATLRNCFNPAQYPTSAPVAVSQVPNLLLPPVITGSNTSGGIAVCSSGVWGKIPTGYTYAWQRNGVTISAGTTALNGKSNSYNLVDADIGQVITCSVTATNGVGASLASVASRIPVVFAPITNFPDQTDYLTNIVAGSGDLTNAAWNKAATTVASGARDLFNGTTAQYVYETTANAQHGVSQTFTATQLPAGNKRYLLQTKVKMLGRRYLHVQYSDTSYANGFQAFIDLQTSTITYQSGGTGDGGSLNRITAVPMANGYTRIEADFVKPNAAGAIFQILPVPTDQNYGGFAGDTTQGVIVLGVSLVDPSVALPTQTAVPAVTTNPVTFGDTTLAGAVIFAHYGTWTNQPTSFSYVWKSAGTVIAGQTANTLTMTSALVASGSITCEVTAVNNFGSSAAVAATNLGDVTDYYPTFLTTQNFPTADVPKTPAVTPAYGTLATANTNFIDIDFTPGSGSNKINTREALDSIAFYNTITGNQTNATGPDNDDPTAGACYAKMRRYPKGSPADLHKFTTDGLKLGVYGANRDAQPYAKGQLSAGGIRLEPNLFPGCTIEIVFKGPTHKVAWAPFWLYRGVQRSPKRFGSNDPYYKVTNQYVTNANLTDFANNDYKEIDILDNFGDKQYAAGRTMSAGVITKSGAIDARNVYPSRREFVAASDGFTNETSTYAVIDDSSVPARNMAAGFHTLTLSWPNDGSNLIYYALDGVIFEMDYWEFWSYNYTDPVDGTVQPAGMHLIIGGQAIPTFHADVVANSVGPMNVGSADALAVTVKSIRAWRSPLVLTRTAGTQPGGMLVPATNKLGTVTPYAKAYTLTGPVSGNGIVGEPANFVVKASGRITSDATITPASTVAGTFSPTTVTLTAGDNPQAAFTFTPSTTGSVTISTTNNTPKQFPTDPAGVAITVAASTPYTFTNTEASNYVAAMTVQPNNTRKGLIDNLYTALKATVDGATLLSLSDELLLNAAHTAQAATLNVISRSYGDATIVNNMTFTADRGFTGASSPTGTSALGIDTNVAGNRSGNKYTQNSATIGAWLLNGGNAGVNTLGNGTSSMTIQNTATSTKGVINDATTITATTTNNIGLTLLTRSSSAARQIYRNGASIGSDTVASTRTPDATTLKFGNSNSGFPSSAQFAVMYQGGSLTANQHTALYNALLSYLQGVGAV